MQRQISFLGRLLLYPVSSPVYDCCLSKVITKIFCGCIKIVAFHEVAHRVFRTCYQAGRLL